ncbi:hypothetical protein BpHYR1_031780 [Brachionus plicatilis]|uniref:Uncharacterized protein n=1 Tax=Brachionus plicatilis TaxID=10195 RepID=A0A3M7RWY0_BRAPC|nr:hypothetical protein BpHYR1_031780 [Brachionus plicatilis]
MKNTQNSNYIMFQIFNGVCMCEKDRKVPAAELLLYPGMGPFDGGVSKLAEGISEYEDEEALDEEIEVDEVEGTCGVVGS